MSQFETTRRVWADLTSNPGASIREICDHTGIHREGVQMAIYQLETAGYIDRDPGVARGRRVVVPMISEFVIHERSPA